MGGLAAVIEGMNGIVRIVLPTILFDVIVTGLETSLVKEVDGYVIVNMVSIISVLFDYCISESSFNQYLISFHAVIRL